MSTSFRSSAVRASWAVSQEGYAVRISGSCECGVSIQSDVDVQTIPGFPSDHALDADVSGALARRVASAMQLEGCMHAARDPRLIAATLLRPERAGLVACLAVVTGRPDEDLRHHLNRREHRLTWQDEKVRIESGSTENGVDAEMTPAEAWEFMASREIIPFSWIGAARAFLGRSSTENGGGPTPEPPTLRSAVTLGSDAKGIEQAEELAREVVSRIAPWGGPQPSTLIWRTLDPARGWKPARSWSWTDKIASMLRSEWGQPSIADPTKLAWWDLAALDARCADVWDVLAAPTRPIEGAPNPFDPSLVLWMLGYAIERIDDDAIVLLAPEV